MAECCMCWRPATAGTAIVDDEYYMICDLHLRMWQRTSEKITLREWCRRITSPAIDGRRPIGRSVICDFFDAHAVIC